MKKIFYIAIIINLCLLTLTACSNTDLASTTTPLSPPSETPSDDQQQIIDEMTNILKQQGIPVKSVQVVPFTQVNPPSALEVTLLVAANAGEKGSPQESGYGTIVDREANIAQQKGLIIGWVNIIFVDSQGNISTRTGSRIIQQHNLSSLSPPFKLNDSTLTSLLDQAISVNAPSTLNITVFQSPDSLRQVIFDLKVPDIGIANGLLSEFMYNARLTINNLNTNQQAQISIYQINIVDNNRTALFNYSNDLLGGGNQSWWQADGIINWGYPAPPPIMTN